MDTAGVDENARLNDHFNTGRLVASDEPANYCACQVVPVRLMRADSDTHPYASVAGSEVRLVCV
jgi:hypothetical protein